MGDQPTIVTGPDGSTYLAWPADTRPRRSVKLVRPMRHAGCSYGRGEVVGMLEAEAADLLARTLAVEPDDPLPAWPPREDDGRQDHTIRRVKFVRGATFRWTAYQQGDRHGLPAYLAAPLIKQGFAILDDGCDDETPTGPPTIRDRVKALHRWAKAHYPEVTWRD